MDEKTLQLRLQELRGEIDLLNRQLSPLQTDIENLQKAKQKALDEFEKDKKQYLAEIEAIKAKGLHTRAIAFLYSSAVEGLLKKKTELQKEQELMVQKTQDEVKGIHENAENREKAVADREENNKKAEESVKNREKQAQETLHKAQEIQLENGKKSEELLQKRQEIDDKIRQSEEAIAQNTKVLDDIKETVGQKKQELIKLNLLIVNKKVDAEKVGQLARIQMITANRLIRENKAKETLLNEKETKLKKKELWLNDREKTQARAYQEIIRKGGTV